MEPEEKKELKLNSPVAAGEPLVFSWPLVETSKYSGSLEILDTIKLVMNDFEQFKPVMERQGGPKIDSIQTKNYDDMKLLCDKYNKAAATISGLWKGATMPGNKRWSSERADPALLKQIHVRAYNRAVSDPSRLNKHYESFSSQTYGETSFDRMQKILDDLKPKERDVFVDLGSGVGNLVMHVAGGSRVKRAVGIEIAELPVQYSEQMKFEFTRWMKWYGKKLRSYDLFRGDFMDEKYRDLITKDATIIFINNFAFKPDLEDKIKRYLLSELKPGTRIVTTKPYATPNANRSITDRQMSDISAMMDVVELPPMQNAASWTGNYVAYYLHTITHAKIANFFANQKLLPALKSSGDSSRRSSSSSSSKTRSSSVANRGSSRESSVASPAAVHPMAHPAATTAYHHASPPASHVASQYDEEHAFGPTTRRKWNDYVTQLERNKKEKKKVIDVVGRSSSEARSAMPKPMISPSSSGGVKGIRWGDGDSFDVETVAAEPLKHHRHAPLSPKRGRPRKVPLPVHRRSSGGTVGNEETKRHIDILHRLTLDAQKRDRTTTNGEADDGLHVTDLPTVNAIGASSKYPNLDAYLNKLREDYEAHLDLMQTDAYRDAILNDIQKEETRRIQLEKRVEVLERQVAGLQHDGVLILRQRLGELNMEAETPSALLAQSKEIVAHHKQIQAHCAALERQNAALDADNTQLAAAIAERDNALLSSGALAAFGISSDLNCDAAKQLIIDNLMQHYRKKRALLADTSALQSEICALENTPPTSIAGSTIAIGDATASSATSAMDSTKTIGVNSRPIAPAAKRSRHRPPRSQGAKRAAASAAKQAQADPVKQEEIERQIQDIVAKALSVDSIAKCQEKERSRRSNATGGGERKRTAVREAEARSGTTAASSPETESADDL